MGPGGGNTIKTPAGIRYDDD